MNSAVSPQQLHANLMIAIDTVDSTALTGIIRALRVIIEARKGELDTAEAELQGRGARGNFREIASNRPRKRSAFGNCTKIGGLWPDKYLSRLPNRERAALAKFLDSPPPSDQRATSRNQYWPVTTPGVPPIDRMPGVEREAIAADSLIEAASPCLHSVFTGDMARDPFPDKPDRAREKKVQWELCGRMPLDGPHCSPFATCGRYSDGGGSAWAPWTALLRSDRSDFGRPVCRLSTSKSACFLVCEKKNKDHFRAVARKSH